jgi:glycosyltransferase involved in cell wall biosynthesis
MKHVAMIGALPESLIAFRGPLIKAIQNQGSRVSAAAGAPLGQIKELLGSREVDCTPIRLQRASMNPFLDLLSLLDLFRFLRAKKPDIAVSYTAKPVVYGLIAARLAGVKHRFALIEGLGFAFSGETTKHRLLAFILRTLYRISLSGCSAVFFLNPDDQKLFEEHGLLQPATRSVRIDGIGIDLRRFTALPIPQTPAFLMVARLLKDKGIGEYFEAARHLKAKYPEVRFRLAGGFDENPSSISRMSLNESVDQGFIEYLGHVSDIRTAYAECSVFVLPSYREGMPVAVMEAMACGRPVVTTDVAGCKETVIHGVNGLIVQPKNTGELISAIELFIAHPDIIASMGSESRRMAEMRFDQDKINDQILGVMQLKNCV